MGEKKAEVKNQCRVKKSHQHHVLKIFFITCLIGRLWDNWKQLKGKKSEKSLNHAGGGTFFLENCALYPTWFGLIHLQFRMTSYLWNWVMGLVSRISLNSLSPCPIIFFSFWQQKVSLNWLWMLRVCAEASLSRFVFGWQCVLLTPGPSCCSLAAEASVWFGSVPDRWQSVLGISGTLTSLQIAGEL